MLVAAAVVALQVPAVQTAATDKLMDKLLDGFDADVTFDKVHLVPFNTLVINGLLVSDNEPYIPSEDFLDSYDGCFAPADTLAYIDYLAAGFSLSGLRKGEGIHLSKVVVKGAEVNLVQEKEGNNIKRMFKLTRKDKKKEGDILDIRKAIVSDSRFSMKLLKKEKAPRKGGEIYWPDLRVGNIRADAGNIRFSDGIFTGDIHELNFDESTGFCCNQASARLRIGNGEASVMDIKIDDGVSSLNLPLYRMSFTSPKDFKQFTTKVRIDAELDRSTVSTRTLSHFIHALESTDMVVDASTLFEGYADDFDLEDLRVATSDGTTELHTDAVIKGLTSKRLSFMASVHELNSDSGGIDNLLEAFSGPEGFRLSDRLPGVSYNLSGKVTGDPAAVTVKALVKSGIGDASTDITVKNPFDSSKVMEVEGALDTEDLDLGEILGSRIIRECCLHSYFNARLRSPEGPSLKIDTLKISRLELNNYDYSRIAATGTLSKNSFDGKIISQDPNCNFLFQGIFSLSPRTRNGAYQFYANVGHADLNAMNIDKRPVSNVSFRTNANFTRTRQGDFLGDVDITDIMFENESQKHYLEDVSISSNSNNDRYRVKLMSGFAEASFLGSSPFTDFIKDFKGIALKKNLPSLFEDPAYSWDGNTYSLTFNCLNASDIAPLVKEDLYIDNNTEATVSIGGDGICRANLRSRRIAIGEKFIKDLDFSAGNNDGNLAARLKCSHICGKIFNLMDGCLDLKAENDDIGVDFTYDNKTALDNKGEFHAEGSLFRKKGGKTGADIIVKPSKLYFNSSEWTVPSSYITLDNKNVKVSGFKLASGDQGIYVDGGYSPYGTDTLKVRFDNLDISLANTLVKDKGADITGRLEGTARLFSNNGKAGLSAALVSKSTGMAGTDLGDIAADIRWNNEFSRYDVMLSEVLGRGSRAMSLDGTFYPATKALEMQGRFNGMPLGWGAPLLSSVFSTVSGNLYGNIGLTGSLKRPVLTSDGTYIRNGRLAVAYTHVPYDIDGPVHIDSNGVHFDDMSITDASSNSGRVNGGLLWNNFKDFFLDTHINSKGLELLNLPESDGQGFYGRLFGTGNVDITGPFSNITINASATTSSDGNLHIPLSNKGKNDNADLLRFKQEEVKVETDPYEEMLGRLKSVRKAGNDLCINIKANATPIVEAFLEIDRSSGNVLNGRGNGVIELEIRPKRKIFNIKGDYIINSGNYKFVALGIASRDFSISDGSSVKFNGEIMESTVDINASYRTKASLSTLIADTTSVNTRRTVDCGIRISDKLRNPSLDFSIDIPDLEPSVKARVDNALSTEDKVQKQFLSLILSNSFIPDEQSGIVNNSSVLYSNVAEIMAGQLNNILEKLDIPIDLGLKYQPNENGNDIFDVAVSTQLFNNRVLVNGNIGNRQYTTGANTNDVVGDLDIEIKIDKSGAVRLSLFSHSADQFTNYLDNSQRNGIGITYQQEFNTVEQMFRYMFTGKKGKETILLEEQEKLAQEGFRTITIERPQ